MAIFTGGPGNDTFDGTPDADTMNGNGGNDTLNGAGGDDTLDGGDGFDVLNGGPGADMMTGGAQNDTYHVDDPGDMVIEHAGGGSDRVFTTLNNYTLPNHVEALHFVGTGNFTGTGNELNNEIIGGNGADTITGGSGNDNLYGRDGNDTLIGGDGFDLLDGGTGADIMSGGNHNDTYVVDHENDMVIESAGGGNDRVYASVASYALTAHVESLQYTGTGNFTGTGNELNNQIIGGNGNDTLNGGDGHDTLYGRAGNDMLNGGDGNDTLYGEQGFDTLDGGAGADTMIGGEHNDTYIVDDAGDVVIELAGGGSDRVVTTLNSYTLGAHVEALQYNGMGDFTGTGNELDNEIIGGSGNDTLSGLDGNDRLFGRDGDDVLNGGNGFDLLDGGTGADIMSGGAQNDVYIVDNEGDVVIEFAGGGSDRVATTLSSYTLPAEVEALQFTGTGSFSGTGNGLANQIIGGASADMLSGGAGNDILFGRGGDDILVGGTGTDTLTGDAGADRFVFDDGDTGLGASADRITDFLSGTDRIDLSAMDADTTTAEDDSFTYIGALPFTGNAGELRYETMGGNTWIHGDTDGDSIADFSIVLTGSHMPVSGDFIL